MSKGWSMAIIVLGLILLVASVPVVSLYFSDQVDLHPEVVFGSDHWIFPSLALGTAIISGIFFVGLGVKKYREAPNTAVRKEYKRLSREIQYSKLPRNPIVYDKTMPMSAPPPINKPPLIPSPVINAPLPPPIADDNYGNFGFLTEDCAKRRDDAKRMGLPPPLDCFPDGDTSYDGF